MQRVPDAERRAPDELCVHQRRVHRAAHVRAEDHATQRERARLRVDVQHDGARAAGVRDLRNFERRADGQRLLYRQIGEHHAAAARGQLAVRVAHEILRHAPALGRA